MLGSPSQLRLSREKKYQQAELLIMGQNNSDAFPFDVTTEPGVLSCTPLAETLMLSSLWHDLNMNTSCRATAETPWITLQTD